MLEALSHAPSSWQLEMIGDGPLRDDLKRRAHQLGIADRVHWHGSVPNAGALLSAFDVLVLSSRTEGTPIVLLEAMHAGIPIVATRVGGVPHVVTPAEALLVPSEQPELIAGALAEIETSPTAAATRTRLARERLSTVFSAASWLAAIDAVYNAAIASRRAVLRPASKTARR